MELRINILAVIMVTLAFIIFPTSSYALPCSRQGGVLTWTRLVLSHALLQSLQSLRNLLLFLQSNYRQYKYLRKFMLEWVSQVSRVRRVFHLDIVSDLKSHIYLLILPSMCHKPMNMFLVWSRWDSECWKRQIACPFRNQLCYGES